MAMYYADDAIIVTNPEVSSVRDSDRILGIYLAVLNALKIAKIPYRNIWSSHVTQNNRTIGRNAKHRRY